MRNRPDVQSQQGGGEAQCRRRRVKEVPLKGGNKVRRRKDSSHSISDLDHATSTSVRQVTGPHPLWRTSRPRRCGVNSAHFELGTSLFVRHAARSACTICNYVNFPTTYWRLPVEPGSRFGAFTYKKSFPWPVSRVRLTHTRA